MNRKDTIQTSRRALLYAALFFSCASLLLLATWPAQAGEAKAPYAYGVGDIQFCPAGKAYGDPSCEDVRTTMAVAITDAKTAAAAGISGTIYVESGSYNDGTGDAISISDFDYGTSLVVQGGVGGGTTTFVRGLNVGYNDVDGLDFTLKDVTISTSNTEHGITFSSNIGDIKVQNVTVSAPNIGIYINGNTGNIELDTINADGNGSYNIYIHDAISEKITLDQIEASSNSANAGIFMQNITAVKGMVLSDVTANNNVGHNICLSSVTGNVSMSNIQASGSTGGAGIITSSITGNLVLEDATINTNASNNMSVGNVSGDVILEQVAASGSTGYMGIGIVNVAGSKGVTLKNVTADSNDDANILIDTITGNVSFSNVSASNSSTGHGIYMDIITGVKGVTFNTVTADGNQMSNIFMTNLTGNAILNNVTAGSSKAGKGLHLGNINGSKGVSLATANLATNFSHNLYINGVPNGNVTLSDVAASGSTGYMGIEIVSVAGSKGVTLKNVTADSNDDANILIDTITGNVSLTTVNANDSQNSNGITINNIQGSKGLTLKDVTANENQFVNIYALTIVGSASLSSVNANLSDVSSGIILNAIQGSKGVTMKTVTADGNASTNIELNGLTGSASLSGVQANSSTTGRGIYLNNIDGSKGISLKSVTASSNSDSNIYVSDLEGGVSLSSVTANDSNSGNGINLYDIKGVKGVSLKAVTTNDNKNANITISTITGDASLSSITANGSSDGGGVYLGSISGSKGVSLKGVTANGNDVAGVYLQNISGNASLSRVESTGNSCGVALSHIDGSKGVSLKTVVADGNNSSNIFIIDIVGDVNLNNVSASNNMMNEGIYIQTVGGAKGVSLKTVTAISNDMSNIGIGDVDPGGVVINGVTANESDSGSGVNIVEVAGTVMIMKSSFNDNNGYGIYSINNSGLFALKGVQGNNNVNQSGAYLESTNNLLVCSSQFIGNGLSGAEAYGVEGDAPGFSLTIAGTDLLGPPANRDGEYNTIGGTVPHVNESSACKVIPVIP